MIALAVPVHVVGIAVEMPAVELVALVTGDSPCQPTMVPELALAV